LSAHPDHLSRSAPTIGNPPRPDNHVIVPARPSVSNMFNKWSF